MTITAKTTAEEDLDVNGDCEIEFYAHGKLLGTLTVYNPKGGDSYIDYTDEVNDINYNLLHLEAGGAIINSTPKPD